MLNYILLASLVQLVERWSPKPNVEGSSPSGRVFYLFTCIIFNSLINFILSILYKSTETKQ